MMGRRPEFSSRPHHPHLQEREGSRKCPMAAESDSPLRTWGQQADVHGVSLPVALLAGQRCEGPGKRDGRRQHGGHLPKEGEPLHKPSSAGSHTLDGGPPVPCPGPLVLAAPASAGHPRGLPPRPWQPPAGTASSPLGCPGGLATGPVALATSGDRRAGVLSPASVTASRDAPPSPPSAAGSWTQKRSPPTGRTSSFQAPGATDRPPTAFRMVVVHFITDTPPQGCHQSGPQQHRDQA